MNDLLVFISAQLDKDEAAAKRAATAPRIEITGSIHAAQANAVREAYHVGRQAAEGVRLDPARRLREVASTRTLVTEILAIPHVTINGDPYFSCSQAVYDDEEPGSGCADDERAGKPCDCGRDQRVEAMLKTIAERWET